MPRQRLCMTIIWKSIRSLQLLWSVVTVFGDCGDRSDYMETRLKDLFTSECSTGCWGYLRQSFVKELERFLPISNNLQLDGVIRLPPHLPNFFHIGAIITILGSRLSPFLSIFSQLSSILKIIKFGCEQNVIKHCCIWKQCYYWAACSLTHSEPKDTLKNQSHHQGFKFLNHLVAGFGLLWSISICNSSPCCSIWKKLDEKNSEDCLKIGWGRRPIIS